MSIQKKYSIVIIEFAPKPKLIYNKYFLLY